MRTLFNGEFSVYYGQMYVDSRTDPDEGPEAGLDECFMGQRSGLCGAAVPGHLFLVTGLHTGSVPLTVELHEREPSLDVEGWEDIVETPFRAASGDTYLIPWEGQPCDLGLPSGMYRVRYHCRGMDETDSVERWEDDPVLDEYLLQFWPAAQERDCIVKQTSKSAAYWHRAASELPPPPTSEELAEAERLTREKEEQEARERRERDERAEKEAWGGRLPSDRLRSVGSAAKELRRLDVALVHAVDDAGPDVQRVIARWAAHRSCEVAGLSGVGWIARGLAELDRCAPFAPPLDDPIAAKDLLFSDPQLPSTVITLPDGTNESQQEMALLALIFGADPDPLKAALVALYAVAGAHGTGWRELLSEVRSVFPETAHAPLPPKILLRPPENLPQYGDELLAVVMERQPGEGPQGFQVVEWRGTEQGQPAAEQLLELAPHVSGMPGDVVYGIYFGDEDGPSVFGQCGPVVEPDWVTGLYVLPDGGDLAAGESVDNRLRCTPDHLAFSEELESIGKEWRAKNESLPLKGARFRDRPVREAQLRELFDRWTVQYPGLVGTVG